MKLFNQFTILKKNLRNLDYAKKNKVTFGLGNAKNIQLIRIV